MEKQKFECTCGDQTCAKCLAVHCIDDNCKVHTKERKSMFELRWEAYHEKPFPKEARKNWKQYWKNGCKGKPPFPLYWMIRPKGSI